jgi:hypothetical protein
VTVASALALSGVAFGVSAVTGHVAEQRAEAAEQAAHVAQVAKATAPRQPAGTMGDQVRLARTLAHDAQVHKVRAEAAAKAAEAARKKAAAEAARKKAAAEAARKKAAAQRARERASRSSQRAPVSSGSARDIARSLVAAHGWSSSQFSCLDSLWQKESGWSVTASNPSSGAYGIPQALPGSKMGAYGGDWRTSARTQIEWGLAYISSTYGTPCAAWSHSRSYNWY